MLSRFNLWASSPEGMSEPERRQIELDIQEFLKILYRMKGEDVNVFTNLQGDLGDLFESKTKILILRIKNSSMEFLNNEETVEKLRTFKLTERNKNENFQFRP